MPNQGANQAPQRVQLRHNQRRLLDCRDAAAVK